MLVHCINERPNNSVEECHPDAVKAWVQIPLGALRRMNIMATKQVIVMRRDLNMRKGKFASQAAHVAMMFITRNNISENPLKLQTELTPAEADWFQNSFTKIVVGCDSQEELESLVQDAKAENIEVHVCIDNGTTEFHGVKTMTCAAFGPEEEEILNKITGHLKLL